MAEFHPRGQSIFQQFCRNNRFSVSSVVRVPSSFFNWWACLFTFVVPDVFFSLQIVVIHSRYTDPDIVQFLKDSSCLDPRFRSMPYLDETEKLGVYTALTLKAVSLNDQQQKSLQVREGGIFISQPSLLVLTWF